VHRAGSIARHRARDARQRGGTPGQIVRVPGMPSRSQAAAPRGCPAHGQPGRRAPCPDQRRRRLRGSDQPVPTPAWCRARQASPTSSRLVGENTALVAVLVAFSTQDRPAGLPHPDRARRRRAHHRLNPRP
jgi:hypothetical protein